MATEIGIIKTLIGTVKVTSSDGTSRELLVGDKVFALDIITTGAAGAVEIEFADGSLMDLGRNTQTVLDDDVFDPQQTTASTDNDVEAMQQALLAGEDPTQTGEATAAGPANQVGSNEGHNPVNVDFIAPVAPVTNGFDTTGIDVVFPEIEQELQAPITADDVPTAVSETVNTNEDTALTIDVLANDSVGANAATISSYTQTNNGTVVLNADGTFTYTPATNYSGPDSFNYTLIDGDGDSSTTTVNIGVTPVADAPNLIMSVSEKFVEQTIDSSNVGETGLGYTITALAMNDSPASVSTITGTNHDGFGVNGSGSGDSREIGSTANATEQLIVTFDDLVSSVDVKFAWLNKIETAAYKFYQGGHLVGNGGETDGITDRVDGPYTLSPGAGILFDEIRFSAPLNNTDDYLIHSITFDKATYYQTVIDNNGTTYHYDLTISAALTDSDGSETLGDVLIDGSTLPAGTTLQDALGNTLIANGDGKYVIDVTDNSESLSGSETLTLVSNSVLVSSDINAITGSVTSTDGGVDTATTQTNVKFEVSNLNSVSETADILMNGDSGHNLILGGSGNDIIFGGAGDDILAGGAGADSFIWNNTDLGTVSSPAHDIVQDFNVNEDVLNLSDLLSDGSHSIEGIEVGAAGSEHLQLNIKDSGGHVVQEIELTGVTAGPSPVDMVTTLLTSGAIDDGI